jgi:hypothetical protein
MRLSNFTSNPSKPHARVLVFSPGPCRIDVRRFQIPLANLARSVNGRITEDHHAGLFRLFINSAANVLEAIDIDEQRDLQLRDTTMSGMYLGTRNGHTLRCYIVDGVITDRYRLLIYEEEFEGKIHEASGELFIDDRRVDFPANHNVAWLNAEGSLAFDAIGVQDVEGEDRYADRYWLFGKVPSFKSFPRGAQPRQEYIDAGVAEFFPAMKTMADKNLADHAAKAFSDDPRIFGIWQTEDIGGAPDNPMWMVHEFRRDGTVTRSTVWIQNGKAEHVVDETDDFSFHEGKLRRGRRNKSGILESEFRDDPLRFVNGEIQYDLESSPGIATWKKIESIEAVDRNRR